jgi:hypothetical protein
MRDGLNDLKDGDLTLAAELFDGAPPARVLAFNWRQALVDDFIGWWNAYLRDTGVGAKRRNEVLRCFYNIFCWMRFAEDRSALDAVLGPVVAVEEPWGTSYQRRMVPSGDGEVPIWRSLFAHQDPNSLGWGGLASRWRRLSVEERCVIWPRYLALMDKVCDTDFESVPNRFAPEFELEPLSLIEEAYELPGSDRSDPAPAFRPHGSRAGFFPAPTPTCRACSASWTAEAASPGWA